MPTAPAMSEVRSPRPQRVGGLHPSRLAGWPLRLLCLAALTALTATPAWAFDKQKAAAKMAQQALEAYESGNYERAAELYGSAYQTDSNPDYLYAQARAEQVGGKPDLATKHLEDVAVHPAATPERVTKAKELLEGLRLNRLDKQVTDGEAAARSGDYKLAAQLWQDVAKQSPKRVDLLYRSAVALQQAGDLPGALAAFDAYIKKAPAGAGDVNQARLRRDAIAEKLNPGGKSGASTTTGTQPSSGNAGTSSTPANPVAGVHAEPASSSSPTLGYIVAGGGAALVIGAVVLYAVTQSDVSAFQAATAANAQGKITGTDLQTATDQHASIQNREIASIAMGGAGLALAGVGTWLILRTPDAKVTWTPGPALAGAGLAWRF